MRGTYLHSPVPFKEDGHLEEPQLVSNTSLYGGAPKVCVPFPKF